MKNISLIRSFFLVAVLTLVVSACSENGGSKSKNTGRISIKTDPEGALVYIRGDQQQGLTPREFGPVAAGSYIFRIEKEGYLPRWEKVDVRKNRTAVLDIKLEPVTTSVLVTTNPAGGIVSLDGKELGPAPYIINNLQMGAYDIGVSRENFVTETRRVIVPREANMPDSPFEVVFNMLGDTGILKIATEPEGAELYLDGKKMVSETPAVLNFVEEGSHEIRIAKKGYTSVTDTVNVIRGKETVPAPYVLKPLPGKLQIAVSPADALVELNGERLNEPGKERSLTPGKYQLKVTKNGYDPEERTITVTADELLRENIVLTRNTGEVRFSINPPGVSITIDGKLVGMSQPNPDNPEEAEQFRIRGVAKGEHVLVFTHPYAERSLKKKFTLETKGETKDLMRLELWVPNADIEVISTKRIYRNGMVIPTAADSDEVIYMESPNVRDTYKKNEVKITWLKRPKVTDPRFKTSVVDLQAAGNETLAEETTATIALVGLPPGSEVFVNDKSYGKSGTAGRFELKVPAGSSKLKIMHKNGINTRKTDSNTVEYGRPIELAAGEVKELKAPPILWVAECDLYLNDGKVYKKCRIKFDDGRNEIIVIETAPGETEEIKRETVRRKEMLSL